MYVKLAVLLIVAAFLSGLVMVIRKDAQDDLRQESLEVRVDVMESSSEIENEVNNVPDDSLLSELCERLSNVDCD